MRLISWNTHHRRDINRHVAALSERAPDIVALQEFNINAAVEAAAMLGAIRLPYTLTNERQIKASGRRNYGLLLAARWPPAGRSSVRRALAGDSAVGGRGRAVWRCELHTTHIPPGASNGRIKVETLQGVYHRLACDSPLPRILCGDFNTPQREFPDGTVYTWGQTQTGALRRSRLGWDAIERSVVVGLADYDLADVFRRFHGYGVDAASWVARRNGREWPRRFDHVFASQQLGAYSCRYVDEWRTVGLSDHAALEVDFAPVGTHK